LIQVTNDPGASVPGLPADQAGRLAVARSKSVMIVTPVARTPAAQYTLSIIRTMVELGQMGIKVRLQWVRGNSNLPRARNELVAEFLASDCTDLLWIDDDMGWQPNDVIRLLASDKDFIGGVGRKKTGTPDDAVETWCARFLPGDLEQDEMGAVRVAGIGTGFAKVSRRVFEAVKAAHPDWKRPGLASQPAAVQDQFYCFYRFVDDPGGLMMSEDIAFCETWRSLGGTVWADPAIELVHVGEREFTGSFSILLQPQSEVS
jgi:hypothetical protein